MKIIYSFIILFASISFANGQKGFSGTAVVGINLAQIQGDNLAGYDKPGISAGFKISYPVKPIMDLSMELLYSTRGSQEKLFGSVNGSGLGTTNLKYIELPVIVSIKDWLIENEGYYKVKAEGGVSLGYLFDVESQNAVYNDGLGNLREQDISFLIGATYNINSHLGFTLRYTRSLVDLYQLEGELISYFLTFRTDYTF